MKEKIHHAKRRSKIGRRGVRHLKHSKTTELKQCMSCEQTVPYSSGVFTCEDCSGYSKQSKPGATKNAKEYYNQEMKGTGMAATDGMYFGEKAVFEFAEAYHNYKLFNIKQAIKDIGIARAKYVETGATKKLHHYDIEINILKKTLKRI